MRSPQAASTTKEMEDCTNIRAVVERKPESHRSHYSCRSDETRSIVPRSSAQEPAAGAITLGDGSALSTEECRRAIACLRRSMRFAFLVNKRDAPATLKSRRFTPDHQIARSGARDADNVTARSNLHA